MLQKYTLDTIGQVAKELLNQVSCKVLLFHGEMGAGKTTLIKEVAKQLGVLDKVSSPTFSLVNEYRTDKDETIFHFDFYRIEQEEEALDMGIEDYFESGHWCLIEWPSKVQNLLPLELVNISLRVEQDLQRTIVVT